MVKKNEQALGRRGLAWVSNRVVLQLNEDNENGQDYNNNSNHR
jgi:hypothetical protein